MIKIHVFSKDAVLVAAEALIDASASFKIEPLPDDEYYVWVRPEIADRIRAAVSKPLLLRAVRSGPAF